jgi:tetratricopeptide (TPR) repeat protein
MMIGETYLALGDGPSAINNYQETLKREPVNPYVFAKMGEAFFLMKDYINAQTAFQQSVGISQQVKQQPQAEAADGLGVLNNPTEAVKKFEEAIQKNDPKQNAYLYAQLGNAYFVLKKYTEARNAYQKSLAINPGQVEGSNGLRMLSEPH